MKRTEKTISMIGWIFWFHVYVGLIIFVYWLITIEKDGPSMFMSLSTTLKIVWIIVLSGAFFLYTLVMLRVKLLFDIVSAKLSIGLMKAQISTIEFRDRLISELEVRKKEKDNVAGETGLRESGQA